MSSFDPFPDDDPLAARLRDALRSEADMVHTSDDSLGNIRARTAGARPWWRHPAALAVAAAAVIGLAAGGLVAVLGGDSDDPVVAGPGTSGDEKTTAPETPTPSESPAPTPTDTPTPIPAEGDVYVYYVMDDPVAGPRLYREQRPNIGTDPISAALLTMFEEPPLDPDYSSPWPDESTIAFNYNIKGDTVNLDLSEFVSAGAATELAAVQQLVYTVTANDPSVKQVRITVNNEAPRSGHADWSEPVARAPMVDVQGLIWLLGPTEGQAVSAPVQISGYGTAFEATVTWQIVDESGQVVAEDFTDAGANGEFGDFSDTVKLEPGTYEIRAFESSAEDGRPLNTDTKTFTVE